MKSLNTRRRNTIKLSRGSKKKSTFNSSTENQLDISMNGI